MIGIYQITVEGDARVYIGSSRNILRRWYEHRKMLRNGRHHCAALQAAFDGKGIAAIHHSVIAECAVEDLARLEREALRENDGRLFNTILWATFDRSGMVMADASKAAISRSLIGNSRRSGVRHDKATKERIARSLAASYARGNRRASPNPQNLAAHNEAVSRGMKAHPKKDHARDAAIVAAHRETRSLKETGIRFGITPGAVWCVIKRCAPEQIRKWERKAG